MENEMDRVIYFDNDDQKIDRCTGETYFDFLDYAFSESDFFMLVYVNYYKKGYTKAMKSFQEALKPFTVKHRVNPSWPGMPWTFCPNTTYKIVFYRNDNKAKEILKRVSCMSAWSCPSYPQDLAFFKGNQCWFYSVGHERIAAIIHATKKDILFVTEKGLARAENVRPVKEDEFRNYDEILL